MGQRIENKFVIQKSFSDFKQAFASHKIKTKDDSYKIVKVTNCATAKTAVSVLLSGGFQNKFATDKFLFVIVFDIDDDLRTFDTNELLGASFDFQKPAIISLESKYDDGHHNLLFCKEDGEKSFKEIKWSPETPDNSFDIGVLLTTLASNVGGSFNGIFLETTIDFSAELNDMRFIDRAAFNNNVLCLRFLRLFNYNLSTVCNENKKILEFATKSCDVNGFQALLDTPFDADTKTFLQAIESLEVFQPQGAMNINLLKTASESGNIEAVSFLLKCSYDVNQGRELSESAALLAWQKENYEVLLTLLKTSSLFPENFQETLKEQRERGKVKNILSFISDLNALHESIERGRVDQVKAFFDANPTIRHAYNVKNESATLTALKAEQFRIYEYLISKGVCLGPHEDINEVLSEKQQISCHEGRRAMMKKMYVHEMHKKYFKKPIEKHLMTLLAHSDVGFDATDSETRGYFKYITDAFEVLNKIEEISAIFKIVAESKFFRIVFDFNRHTCNNIDPTTCRKTKGTSYFKSGYVYIGAKALLAEEEKHEVLGTLAHELTHYAMQLVYENNCKPYRPCDVARLKEFQTISLLCEFVKEKESKIFYVFNYPEAHQHAELIVRVPQLLAVYARNAEKLNSICNTYRELFEFFRDKTFVDLRNEHSLMMPKRETAELNDYLGVVQPMVNSDITLDVKTLNLDMNATDRILLVITNCIRLTIKAIHQQLERDMKVKVENFFLFARPSALENEKMKVLLLKAFNLPTRPTIVFECEDEIQLGELKEIAAIFKATERIIFVVKAAGDDRRLDAAEYQKVYTKHSWLELPESTQNVLWKYKVNFQGAELLLRDLVVFPSRPYEDFPFCDLLRLKLKVSAMPKFKDIDFFMERKFSSQSLEDFSFESISKLAKSRKIILISDDPGAGKTTTFKTFALKLKADNPSHWVSYVDLKQFISEFEQNENFAFKEPSDVAYFIGDKMFKLEGFELEVFCQLFSEDRVILLFDGIDEICPNFKGLTLRLLEAAQSLTKNQLWISTRPHVANDLSEALGQEFFHMKPFTQVEQRSFYRQFFENRNIEMFDLNRNIAGIEKLMNFLSKNRLFWSPITGDISTNPLFMRITAEIYDDDVMHESSKGKCLTLCNLYLMYDRFIERKFSLWMLDKGRLSLSDQLEMHRGSKSIFRAHLRIALERTFNDSRLKALVEESSLTLEQILRVGLVNQTGCELQFIHRTFAEFFVADFLFKRIFCHEVHLKRVSRNEKRLVMRLFVRVLSSNEFQMIRAFLGNALELLKGKRDAKKFTKLAKLYRNESKRVEREKMLSVAVADGCVNLTTLLLEFQITSQNAIVKLMHKKKRSLNNVLVNSIEVHRTQFETVKSLWSAALNVYSRRDVKSFLMKANPLGKTLLHITAFCEERELVEFLLNEIKLAADVKELRGFLLLLDCNGQNALAIALKYNKHVETFQLIWETYCQVLSDHEQKAILREMTTNFATLRDIAFNSREIFTAFVIILEEKFTKIENKKWLTQSDDFGMTILHWLMIWKFENVSQCFNELLKRMLSSDELEDFNAEFKSADKAITASRDDEDQDFCEMTNFKKISS